MKQYRELWRSFTASWAEHGPTLLDRGPLGEPMALLKAGDSECEQVLATVIIILVWSTRAEGSWRWAIHSRSEDLANEGQKLQVNSLQKLT